MLSFSIAVYVSITKLLKIDRFYSSGSSYNPVILYKLQTAAVQSFWVFTEGRWKGLNELRAKKGNAAMVKCKEEKPLNCILNHRNKV